MDSRITTLRAEVAASIRNIHRLEATCPEETESSGIFVNKYKIRGTLVAQADKAKTLIQSCDSDAVILWGFLTAKLANNFIETEEPRAEARRRLLEIITFIESRSDLGTEGYLHKFSGLLQYTYNSLAVTAEENDTDENKSAIFWLTKAQNLYKEYKMLVHDPQHPECWESLALLNPSSPQACLLKEVAFETNYTTTLFMLAQVYANRADRRRSAEFCHETLRRQLLYAPIVDDLLNMFESENHKIEVKVDENCSIVDFPTQLFVKSFRRLDPKDWANNAAILSEFYGKSGEIENALECLMTSKMIAYQSCQTVKTNNDDTSDVNDLNGTKLWADISRLSAQYSLGLLEKGSKAILGSQFTASAEPPDTVPTYGSLFGRDTTRALQEAYGESFEATKLMDVVCELSKAPTSYPSALRLFRWTCRSLSDALVYYQLDERCSDAIELIRAHASAYGFLATFEVDLSRKCCMQKRRVDLLQSLLDQLNPRFYMLPCRLIMSECGEALTALRDLNEEKMKRGGVKPSKATPSSDTERAVELAKQARKVNALGRRALQMYERLLASFLRPTDQRAPELYEETWLPYVLMAHFYSARLHSKTITFGAARNRVMALQSALKAYEVMVDVGDRHVRSGCRVDTPEIEIAREMIQLLTAQIARTPLDE